MESSSANGASDILCVACVCVCFPPTLAHSYGYIPVSNLQFSPNSETVNQLKVMTVYLFFPHFPHLLLLLLFLLPLSSPLPDLLTRPLCLFILSFCLLLLFFFPSLPPLLLLLPPPPSPSPFLLCYTVERQKKLFISHTSQASYNQ